MNDFIAKEMVKKLSIAVFFFVVVSSIGSKVDKGKIGIVKREGNKFTEKANISFIDFEAKKAEVKIENKTLQIHYGRIVWNEQSGWKGKPAIVPIQIFRTDKKNKRFIPMAQFFPNKDGIYYFAVEKVKTEVNRLVGSPYVLAAFPQRALAKNVPEKVLEFFREKLKESEGDSDVRTGQRNQVH